jgi:predicted ATPase
MLPDLLAVRSIEREEDRHCYLKLRYEDGSEVPSWLVSDGTLRVLGLTLLAYLPEASGTYLIEEPENGIHPTGIDSVFQSLTSVYGGQVLIATHSPVMVSLSELDQLLCFGKSPEGAVAIVSGPEHPMLSDWRHEVDLGTYLAGGVLG